MLRTNKTRRKETLQRKIRRLSELRSLCENTTLANPHQTLRDMDELAWDIRLMQGEVTDMDIRAQELFEGGGSRLMAL